MNIKITFDQSNLEDIVRDYLEAKYKIYGRRNRVTGEAKHNVEMTWGADHTLHVEVSDEFIPGKPQPNIFQTGEE